MTSNDAFSFYRVSYSTTYTYTPLLKRAKETKGVSVIHGCVLVEFGFDETR
jgi:hypothetical protein